MSERTTNNQRTNRPAPGDQPGFEVGVSDLLDRLARHAEAEVYELRRTEEPVKFKGGKLESARTSHTVGRAVRVVKDGRLGFSTTTDVTDGHTIVENALAAAEFGDSVTLDLPSEQPTTPMQSFDEAVAELDPLDLIEMGEALVEAIRAYDPEIQVNLTVIKTIEDTAVLNSRGLDARDRRTTLAMGAGATRTRSDEILIIPEDQQSRRRADVDPEAMGRLLVQRMRWAAETASVRSGPMKVLFRSVGLAPLVLPLQLGLNGRHVYHGTSPLEGKLGEPVFDARFTLVDDGPRDFAPSSAPFDDEGVPTRTKPLIEEGVVRQFLYDLKTAAQAGARPTGNGFKRVDLFTAGFHIPPQAAPATWVIPPGGESLEALLAGLDEVLIVDNVLGLGQGNLMAGEFSNTIGLGYLMRRGEIVGRVKNTMIAGNVYDLLRDQLVAVGNRPEWVYGMLYAPALLFDGVSVVAKG
ncbi:MAG: TldD/PmbA family protein [Anaerolineae bacterium]|nr:TldD/PmbA family protein [Anaerolineae bacterium]